VQGLELGIDRFDIQTVKVAGNCCLTLKLARQFICHAIHLFTLLVGLLHDVGHGPFSHLFEREFLPLVLGASNW